MSLLRIKQWIGSLGFDGPRLVRCLLTETGWHRMRNRNESITVSSDGVGVRCNWEYQRSLHLCDVFPFTSEFLLRKACQQWSVVLSPEQAAPVGTVPKISFVIGHRGVERLPHLLATLRSIRGQTKIPVECVVVEQDAQPKIHEQLPSWVRYVHAPLPKEESHYNRSAAFNAGERCARGDILVLHDSDLIVPSDYAAEVWRKFQAGYEVVRLHRFIFYAERTETDELFSSGQMSCRLRSERVVENAVGGSLAVSRIAYEALGGMDEEFVGWGGEDNEFWDRCLTRKVWDFGYLPFIHLWHPSLADRQKSSPPLSLLEQKRTCCVAERIQALRDASRDVL